MRNTHITWSLFSLATKKSATRSPKFTKIRSPPHTYAAKENTVAARAINSSPRHYDVTRGQFKNIHIGAEGNMLSTMANRWKNILEG